ncbi:MAG: efflux RND transporter periplasmic adaptor subunit [Deltaproteobacteria bacterium]|nr:efflux RND transporter periplasmic adaptor subunit [Deltaproteobacteria bacterium]
MSSEIPPPTAATMPTLRPPHGSSPITKIVIALALVGMAVPVGLKVKSAVAKQKSLEVDRARSAEEATAKSSGPLTVKVLHGESTTWAPRVPFDGTLQPVQEANLAFKATGPLAKLNVKIGDFVKKGDLLAALDATEAHAQSSAAAAQIKAAKAQLALAKDSAERTAAMVKSGAAPEVQQTQASGQLDLVSAQLEGAQAQLALAGANVKNHTLYAPFSGFVTMAPTALGGLVAAGMPIFQMKDVSRLRLIGTVNELDASLVKVGAEVTVRIESANRTVQAKVTAVLPVVDPATRRIVVEAELPNDHEPGAEPILAGTFVRAHIAGGSALPVIKLPSTALRPGAQDEILVVEKGKLRVAKIVFTRGDGGALLVRSGVTASETVLANPPPEAKDGQAVEVAE